MWGLESKTIDLRTALRENSSESLEDGLRMITEYLTEVHAMNVLKLHMRRSVLLCTEIT